MRDEHVRLVPIIDAGIKIEKGYKAYEEGVKNGYFCKNEDGTDFVGGVWPGRVHFPDPLNKKAREWFGESYRFLIDKGIEGFWNDMNEPALFYSAAGLDRLFNEVRKFEKQNMEISVYNEFLGLVGGLPNNREDYLRIYHNADGKKIRHDKVHNLYGYGITRAAGEAFEKISPKKRILLFSRSSCIGMHRYAGIWMGDNKSWWSHLLMNLKMLPSLNMVGILYTGADIGGFGADATEDLVLRWTQLAVFNSLMRNHSAMGTRRQEAYRFDHTDAFRKIIGIRYSLIPYLYSEFMKAALTDDMMFRPLSFDYPGDTFARQVEDQVMVGDGLMITPVYTQNATGRYVYLPEHMLMICAASADEYECRILEAGHHYIDIPLNEMAFFLRPGHLLPLVRPAEYVDCLNTKKLKVIGWKGAASSYDLYDDDGESRNYSLNDSLRTICISKDGVPEAEGGAAPELYAELY